MSQKSNISSTVFVVTFFVTLIGIGLVFPFQLNADSICSPKLRLLRPLKSMGDEEIAISLIKEGLRNEIKSPWELTLVEKTALSIVTRLKVRLSEHGLNQSEVFQELEALLSAAEDELRLRFKKLKQDEGVLDIKNEKTYRNRMATATLKAIALSEQEWRSMLPEVSDWFDSLEDQKVKEIAGVVLPRIAVNLEKRVRAVEKDSKLRLKQIREVSKQLPTLMEHFIQDELKNFGPLRTQRIADQIGKRLDIEAPVPAKKKAIVIEVDENHPFAIYEGLRSWIEQDLKSATTRPLLNSGVADLLASEIYWLAGPKASVEEIPSLLKSYYHPFREELVRKMREKELTINREHPSDLEWFEAERSIVRDSMISLQNGNSGLPDPSLSDLAASANGVFIETLNILKKQVEAEAKVFSESEAERSAYIAERLSSLTKALFMKVGGASADGSEALARELIYSTQAGPILRKMLDEYKERYLQLVQEKFERSSDPRLFVAHQIFEDSLDSVVAELFWRSRFQGDSKQERDKIFDNFSRFLGRVRTFDDGSIQPVYRYSITRARERLPNHHPSILNPRITANIYLDEMRVFLEPGFRDQDWIRKFEVEEGELLPHELQFLSQFLRSDSNFWRSIYDKKSPEAAAVGIPVRDYVESFMPQIAEWTVEALKIELAEHGPAISEEERKAQMIRVRNFVFEKWDEFRNPIPNEPEQQTHILKNDLVGDIPLEPEIAERLKDRRVQVEISPFLVAPRKGRQSKESDGLLSQGEFFARRNPNGELLTAVEERAYFASLEAIEKPALRELLLKDPNLIELLDARLEQMEAGDLKGLGVIFYLTGKQLKDEGFLHEQFEKFKAAVHYLKLPVKEQNPQELEGHLEFLLTMTRAYYNRVYLSQILSGDSSVSGLGMSREFESMKTEWQTLRSQFMDYNYGLVLALAKTWRTRNLDKEDRVSEAAMGLMNAVDYLEIRQGFKFSTYYYDLGGKKISRADRQFRPIKWMPKTPKELREFIEDFYLENGFYPTATEVASLTSASLKQAKTAVSQLGAFSSIVRETDLMQRSEGRTQPVGVSREASPIDEVARWDSGESIELQQLMAKVLSDRERLVLESRFGMNGETPQTLKKIGEKIGVKTERARQIESEALLKLKVVLYVRRSRTPENDPSVQIVFGRLAIKTEIMGWKDLGVALSMTEDEVKQRYEEFIAEVESEIPGFR